LSLQEHPSIHRIRGWEWACIPFSVSTIREVIGVWDTRNSSFYPRSGLLAEGYLEQYSRVWASDMTFGFFHLDVRGYIPAGKEGVVALLVKEAF
jgi:hypothetical protein